MISKYEIRPLSEVLTQYQEYINEPEPIIYPKISVKLYGKGAVLDGYTDGSSLKMKRHQIAKQGQVILSEIWGKKGAIGIVPSDCDGALCTSHFFLFDICEERIDKRYLQAIFTANYLSDQLNAEAKGTTGYAAVRPKHLLAATIPLPPLQEQRRIVARIEELIAKVEEARGITRENDENELKLLLSEYYRITKNAKRIPMRQVAPLIRRPVRVELSQQYYELGIRSFGKGTFHKPSISGASLGSKKIFRIEKNDLLFNIVFAWEGAVAVAKPEDHGRVGSHRFLTCVPKPHLATASFLCFHFLTQEGLGQLIQASPGSAGRNKTLGISVLENIKVPIPPLEEQLKFDNLQSYVDKLKQYNTAVTTELDAILPSILDKAFKGEL